MDASFIAFLAISVIVIVTPGPDTALTIRNAIAGGGPAGLATAAGVSVGQLVWSAATSLGLVGLLLASEPVFHALRWVGALYLIYLGLQSLRAAWRGGSGASQKDALSSRGTLRPRAALIQGLINDLANPKMAAFFAWDGLSNPPNPRDFAARRPKSLQSGRRSTFCRAARRVSPSSGRTYPAAGSNRRRAIHRFDSANSVSTCAAFFAMPR
jgi:hypothetical protein